MWKYVARRIKDTVERTKNVIDVRLTWATAGNGNGSPDGQFTETSPQCIIKNYSLWSHLPPGHDNRKRFCGSNKKQDKRDDDEPDYGFQRKVWEALFWTQTLIFTYQLTRFGCNQKLYKRENRTGCRFTHQLLDKTQSLHGKILSRFVLAAPDEFIGRKAPVCVEPRESFLSNDFLNLYSADQVNNDLDQSKLLGDQRDPAGMASTSTQTAGSSPVDDAIAHLLSTIGSIEFMLGVQNMAANNLNDAASHFKLGTTHRHPGATFNLGLCYELGMGVRKDTKKAMECYRSAAALGHPKALYNLGVFYARGVGGLKKNRAAARECFVAAATTGSPEAKRALEMTKTAKKSDDINPLKKRLDSVNDEGYKSDPTYYYNVDEIHDKLFGLDDEFKASVTLA